MVYVLLLVALASLAAAVVLRHFLPLLRNHDLPKGSFGWPLIGETIGFLGAHPSNTTGGFLQDHIARYGTVFKSHLFGAPTVVSCDEELNHFVLHNEERLFQCNYPGPIRTILGDSSTLVVTGERHRQLRSMFLSLVASTGLKANYLASLDESARSVVASWRGLDTISFCEEARKFPYKVIMELVLGLSPDEPVARRILQEYQIFMKGVISFPITIPGTPFARAVKARKRISETMERFIEERKRNPSKQAVFLDVLLANKELSHEDKVGFLLDSLLAGHETTSVLLSILVYFLGKSPNIVEQLKKEHETIRSSKGKDEPLTADDYRKMEYTQRVISEGLRCGNIVKLVHRKALKDITYKGYVIPAGWKVLPILGAVHLDPSHHVEPEQFQPCRWEGLNQSAGKSFAPFGGGARLCPGSEIVKVEAAFFLHHLVLNYRWRMDDEDVPMLHQYVEFKKGLPIQLEPL
ncbi:hypothetical protein GQ55_9G438200 [Panicum hallii var. hallii]|jgi:cytochrome P450 family 724 subfamily B polypeptide 1|uniref:Cytochrome P450 724B1 n=1 Tax=Panicum hallii var. hallii TaxID=1504633 RepID=A0A2T7CB96_9POAL|nr:hypothetical protein GQ55_9G438200 [Panicum hallii var. hallii]